MNNSQMFAAVMALPDPEAIVACKLSDSIGSGRYYSAQTVIRMLADERQRCAKKIRECNTAFTDKLADEILKDQVT